MKKIVSVLACAAVLGIAFVFVGSNAVSAKRAEVGRGTGCLIRLSEDPGDYGFDAACQAQAVLKLDDDGLLDFYVYQDHGQTSWHPETAFRDVYDDCYEFSFGEVCGTVTETVTPSGEYKSSFKAF